MFLSYSLHVSIVGFFTIRQKRIPDGGAFAEGNSAPQTTLAAAMNTPLSQCHAPLGATQYNAACHIALHCTLNWTAAGMLAGREAEKERGRMDDWREGARWGWDGGSEQGNTR